MDEKTDDQQASPAGEVTAGTVADMRRAARQASGDVTPAVAHTRLYEAEQAREGGPRQSVLADLGKQRQAADEQAIGNNEGYDITDYTGAAAAMRAADIECSDGMARSAFVWTGRRRLTHDELVEVVKALEEREV